MLAVVQMRSTGVVAWNLSRASALVAKAAKEMKAKFVCLPEGCDYLGSEGGGQPHVLDEGSQLIRAYAEMARTNQVWLSLGGLHEKFNEQGTKLVQLNTHVLLDDRGEVRAQYRKVHLFDALVDGGWCESETTGRGDKLVLVRGTPVGTVGLSTCYDVRFPAMFQAYAQAGADVVLIPSAFMVTTGRAHWEVLMRARAIETQCYVAAAAQCGAHNPKRTSYGHSLIIDPFGKVLVDLGDTEHEGVGVAQVDFDYLRRVRASMPMVHHQAASAHVVGVRVGNMSVL